MRFVFLTISILVIVKSGIAQKSNRLIPIIDSVTVIGEKAYLSWSFLGEDTYQLSGFKIYRAFGPDDTDFEPFKDVDSLTFSYTDPFSNPTQKSERYRVAAYSATLDSLSPSSQFHQTIYHTADYDSCLERTLLTWNPYLNWPEGVNHYKLFIQRENDNYIEHQFDDTSYSHINYEANTNYTYYVRAINDNKSSTSNIVSVFTTAPKDPEYLNFHTVSVTGFNDLTLRFSTDLQADIFEYELLRSSNRNSGYSVITTFNHSTESPHHNYSDNIPTSQNINYYYINAVNTCNNIVFTSDTLNNILLQVDTSSSFTNTLSWNSIIPGKSDLYSIYRSVDEVNFEEIAETNTRQYTDNLLAASTDQFSGTFCYYIESQPLFPEANAINNKSNIECIFRQPEIFIPTIFTPNSDGKNDTFKPNITFVSENNYVFVIYNRWGEIIFETKNIYKSWDGKFKGNPVAEGTYIYYLKFATSENNIIEKSGSISVLYP